MDKSVSQNAGYSNLQIYVQKKTYFEGIKQKYWMHIKINGFTLIVYDSTTHVVFDSTMCL